MPKLDDMQLLFIIMPMAEYNDYRLGNSKVRSLAHACLMSERLKEIGTGVMGKCGKYSSLAADAVGHHKQFFPWFSVFCLTKQSF